MAIARYRVRRALLLTVTSWPLAVIAQQAKKVWRIGYLAGAQQISAVETFQQRLRELGYVDGKNLVIEWRLMEGRTERTQAAAAELVGLNVNCIAASGVSCIRATWCGLFAPARTPATIVGKLHLESVKALALPGLGGKLADLGMEVIGTSPDEFAAIIKSEIRNGRRSSRKRASSPISAHTCTSIRASAQPFCVFWGA